MGAPHLEIEVQSNIEPLKTTELPLADVGALNSLHFSVKKEDKRTSISSYLYYESIGMAIDSESVMEEKKMNLDLFALEDTDFEKEDRTSVVGRYPSCPPFFPPEGLLADLYLAVLVVGLGYGSVAVFGGEIAAPGGTVSHIVLTCFFSWLGGEFCKLVSIHPFVGTVMTGFMLRNIPYINIASRVDPAWSSTLRTIAIGVVLSRAGLCVSTFHLSRLSWVCLRLALLPFVTETIATCFCARYLLDYPWTWGVLLGLMLSGSASAIVVPTMLVFRDQGYGNDQGIPTLLMAASVLENILVLGGFGILMSFMFSDGSLGDKLLHVPLNILIGVAYGGLLGIIAWHVPSLNQKHVVFLRVLMLFSGGSFALFMGKAMGITGAGFLGCMVLAYVAALGWRKTDNLTDKVISAYSSVWRLFLPILVGLSGATLNLDIIDKSIIEHGLATLFCGLFARVIALCICFLGSPFNLKERAVMGITWLIKATLQVAFGSLALDGARSSGAGSDSMRLGMQILTMAMLSVLITAPVFTGTVGFLGPRILKKDSCRKLSQDTIRTDKEILTPV